MKRKLLIQAALIINSVLLYGLYASWPEAYASTVSTELPNKVYEVYGVSAEEAKGDNRLKVITVNYDGEIKRIFSRSSSPVTALIDSGYSLSNRNRLVSTSPISDLQNHSFIQVYTYRTTIDEILLEIPYETILKGSILCKSLAQQETEQEGVLGVMTQRIKRTYKGDMLIAEEIVEENVQREARPEIIVIKGPEDVPSSVPQRGYACGYWEGYIDNSLNATTEEKEWLKFVMYCESGCNAESNKAFYKGLFQWSPCLWYKQFPSDNIFDGELQIKRTLEKLRAGANPGQMWPACHNRYKSANGELSWLQ